MRGVPRGVAAGVSMVVHASTRPIRRLSVMRPLACPDGRVHTMFNDSGTRSVHRGRPHDDPRRVRRLVLRRPSVPGFVRRSHGLSRSVLVGPEQGAVHTELAVGALAPGGWLPASLPLVRGVALRPRRRAAARDRRARPSARAGRLRAHAGRDLACARERRDRSDALAVGEHAAAPAARRRPPRHVLHRRPVRPRRLRGARRAPAVRRSAPPARRALRRHAARRPRRWR